MPAKLAMRMIALIKSAVKTLVMEIVVLSARQLPVIARACIVFDHSDHSLRIVAGAFRPIPVVLFRLFSECLLERSYVISVFSSQQYLRVFIVFIEIVQVFF